MTYSTRSSLRRLTLMASGSLAALCLLGSGAANAQTCPGDYCTGTYDAIDYEHVLDFAFITLGYDLNVTTGGFRLSADNGAYTPIYTGGPDSPLGLHINNDNGAGFEVDNPLGFFDVFLANSFPPSGPFSITGTTAGVKLSGSGYFYMGSGMISASQGAGIDATAPTDGFIDLTLVSTVTGSTAAIKTSGGGDVSFSTGDSAVLDGNLVFGSRSVLFQNNGLWTGGTMSSSGATTVSIINGGVLEGTFSLSGSGQLGLTNNGTWRVTGDNLMGAGSLDQVENKGVMVVGGAAQSAATTSIGNLETWNNSGLVLFGANSTGNGSDGVANDRLVFTSPTTLTGLDGGLFVMDVAFGSQAQLDCSAAVAADCMDFGGSIATGTTPILINNIGGTGSLAPIVLIDNASESSDFNGFVLSPDSSGYAAVGGGILKIGVFEYDLSFKNGQFVLTPHVNTSVLGLAHVPAMVDSIWSATTGHWQNRQVDLRDSLDDADSGAHFGVWVKALGNNVERTAPEIMDFGGSPVVYDQSYMQKTRGFIGGLDLVNVGDAGHALVVGAMAGKIDSDVTFKGRSANTTLEGSTYGAYASYVAGPLFVDGLINVNNLDVFYPMIDTANFDQTVKTVGAQVEAGYRLNIRDGAAFLEPIATLAYVKTDLHERQLGDNLTADFGDNASFKGAVGLRLGGSMDLAAAKVGLAVTGRVWQDISGDHGLVLRSGDIEQRVDDDLGTLGDVGVQLNLGSRSGRWSGFADYGFKFRDGYSDSTASLGLRMNF